MHKAATWYDMCQDDIFSCPALWVFSSIGSCFLAALLVTGDEVAQGRTEVSNGHSRDGIRAEDIEVPHDALGLKYPRESHYCRTYEPL